MQNLLGAVGEDGQTEQERKIVAHVKSKVEESRSSANRVAHEGIWMTNIAYLLGYDGIAYNTTLRQFQPIDRAQTSLKRGRLHVNKILPTIQNRLARLCKNPPKYDVRPESNSTEDKDAARLSLQVLTALWDKLSLNKKRIALYMWVQQCGHAWVKVSWDEMLGNPMNDPLSGGFQGYEGDVRADVVSPFEVFPDPTAKSDDDVLSSWLIQAKVRKLDYFRTQYPEKGHLVKSEDAWLLSAQYEQRINSLNSKGPSSSGMQEQMKNSAIELIKYEARSKDYPNGRMIVCANGILLEDKELPVGEIPFRKFDDVQVGGKFYSEAIITHLRPVQDQFNETVRRRADWVRKFVAGKYKAARGSGLAQEALHNGDSEVVYYTPVPNAPGGPEPVQVPSLPQWAYQEEDRLNQMFNDISGIAEVDKGNMPSASIPAIGMQLLTEQTDTRIGVMTEQHEHAWAGVGSLILKYVEKNYQLPRKLKIAGPSLQYTVKEVSGDMIKSNTDVIVIRGSSLPGSKTLRNQDIMNRFQQGLLGNPADPKVIEKVNALTEFGDLDGCFEDHALDMSQIQRGIDSMEGGVPVEVNEADNHALWFQELNRYRKGDKFEALPPEIQGLFQQTMEAHLQEMLRISNAVPPQVPGDPMDGPQPGEPPPPPQGAPTDIPEGTPPTQFAPETKQAMGDLRHGL